MKELLEGSSRNDIQKAMLSTASTCVARSGRGDRGQETREKGCLDDVVNEGEFYALSKLMDTVLVMALRWLFEEVVMKSKKKRERVINRQDAERSRSWVNYNSVPLYPDRFD